MALKKIFSILIYLPFLLYANIPIFFNGCSQIDTKYKLKSRIKNHQVRKLKYWDNFDRLKIDQKIYSRSPPEIVEYLRLNNQLDNFKEIPTSLKVPEEFIQDVKMAIKGIPQAVRRKISKKLAGIFFVKNLGSSGFMEDILNNKNQKVAGWIALDYKLFNNIKANKWATWRENTAFRPNKSFHLEVVIEKEAHNNRQNAIQFLLLHEIAHLMTIGTSNIHPSWNQKITPQGMKNKYTFMKMSWFFKEKSGFESIYDKDFPERKNIRFYQPNKSIYDTSYAKTIYEKLYNTNFFSLYGATNPFEDFAESFTIYIHSVLLKKPYYILIKNHQQKVIKKFEINWKSDLYAMKKSFISNFLLTK